MEIKCEQTKIALIEAKKLLLVQAGKIKFQNEMKQIDQ